MHIMDIDKAEEHPYTKPARLVDGKLTYHQEGIQAKLFEYEMRPDEQRLYDHVTQYLMEPRLYAFQGNSRRLLLISFHRLMASSLAALAKGLDKVAARELAEHNGFRLLSAFDDPDVIAGQGTVGLEIAAAMNPDVVIVPIGGGGLASGVALALKSQGVRIVGAQVEGVDAMARALRGDRSLVDPRPTLADGVRVKEPGYLTERLLRELLDDVVIVREAELRETLVRLALEEHVIAEGAGALALAAGKRVAGKRKCAVISGGNVDATVLATLLSEVRPRPPRKPRRRARERLPQPAAKQPPLPAGLLPDNAAPQPRPVAAAGTIGKDIPEELLA